MVNVHGGVDESCHPSWAGFPNEFGNLQEHNVREHGECVQHHSKLNKKKIPKKFWMWETWNIHHHHGRDQYWSTVKLSNGRRQKLVSTLTLFHVLVGWNNNQESHTEDGKAKLKISGCIHHIKKLWESMEKKLDSSDFSKDFRHCLFFKKSWKTWRTRTSNQKTSRTRSPSCQCSMTFFGKQMMRVASRTLRKSRITRRNSYQDIGHFGVQVRKDMVWRLSRSTRTVSHSQQNGTAIQKLVILSSQQPVLWVVGSWNRKEIEVLFTSMEILWIRNFCFKQFVPWTSSVSMRQ